MRDLIAFSGKMSCGKSTISSALSHQYGYQVLSIGSSIKETSKLLITDKKALYDYLYVMLDDKVAARRIYNKLLATYLFKFNYFSRRGKWKRDNKGHFIKTNAYRKLLQTVATILRNNFGDDIWVKFFAKSANRLSEEGTKVICDDLRLPLEKRILSDSGFSIIRINVDENERIERIKKLYGEISSESLNHPTETALDNDVFDFTISTSENTVEQNIELLTNFLCD